MVGLDIIKKTKIPDNIKISEKNMSIGCKIPSANCDTSF